MMTSPIVQAFRLLARFWLTEIGPDDLTIIAALPDLAETLPTGNEAADLLDDLAVEYQRLFGFNIPPYESVFIDPSAMLRAPATERVQQLYQQGNWTPPAHRAGAPDHIGLQLLALADWRAADNMELANQLHQQHLALWVPLLTLGIDTLQPAPFYSRLANLTRDLLLTTLPASPPKRLFPALPPPPVYRASDSFDPFNPDGEAAAPVRPKQKDNDLPPDLRRTLKRILVPREAGVYLTRQQIGQMSQQLSLPGVMAERYRMLINLARGAIQYDEIPRLMTLLDDTLHQTGQAYQQLGVQYAAWQPYQAAWTARLDETREILRRRE